MRSSIPILARLGLLAFTALGRDVYAQPLETSADGGAPAALGSTNPSTELAQPTTPAASASSSAPAAAAPKPESAPAQKPVLFSGYAEAFYQWNFRNPSNGITNFRGFDNRHNSFTIANVAVQTQWDYKNLLGAVALQIGHTPSTYYLAEPSSPGAGGANGSNADLWKYIQQAYVGYRIDVAGELTLSAGLFLSPIGPESMAIKDNWNWSRSNLFFGLPFYHTGARATYSFNDKWAVTLAGYNGWNSVVDNNSGKSVSTQVTYTTSKLSSSLLYFGGSERSRGAPEGKAWRHLFDAHATWDATSRLSLRAHANTGFEPNEFGMSHWVAGALYARVRILNPLFFAVRGDAFYEHSSRNSVGSASPIFWPAPWVSSGTVTVDVRPHERVSLRLEFRHDHAGGDMFFGGEVASDGTASPNRVSQDTLTLGATTWL